ncbi:hypothetical protein MKR81_22220 [Vibrio campbellii]|uniref:hypothetical protein n=1 Tax=Vibrio campbellii TaxID=680 RepID=UPI001F07E4C1|nr:hypothetical protein [Vibrio campbellii]UMM04911.1 hypothetical protein MKR81_22220 [Vibrio campbellii]
MILEKLKRASKSQTSAKGKAFSPYMIIVISNNNEIMQRVQNYFSAYNVEIIDYQDDIESLETYSTYTLNQRFTSLVMKIR